MRKRRVYIAAGAVIAVTFAALAPGCDTRQQGDKGRASTAADSDAIIQLYAKENVRPTLRNGEYWTFGATQLYRSSDRIWLFVDVEVHTPPSGYSPRESAYAPTFHAYEIDRNGLRNMWTASVASEEVQSGTSLIAHKNFSYFFLYDGSVHGCMLNARTYYRLEAVSPDGDTAVVRVDPPGFIYEAPPDMDSTQIEKFFEMNSEDGFHLIGAGNYGYGTYPPGDYVAEDLGIRISFEPHERPEPRMGWKAVTATGGVSGKRWRRVLLNVDALNDEQSSQIGAE